MNPDVTVVMPFDWVGSVLVPAAAILVSAAIAIWVASAEQRRAQRAQLHDEAASLIRALNDWSRASQFSQDTAVVDEAHGRVQAHLRAFASRLSKRDLPIADFLDGALYFVSKKATPEGWVITPLWMGSILDSWLRGEVSTRDLREHIPSTEDAYWSKVHPEDLEKVLSGEVPRRYR